MCYYRDLQAVRVGLCFLEYLWIGEGATASACQPNRMQCENRHKPPKTVFCIHVLSAVYMVKCSDTIDSWPVGVNPLCSVRRSCWRWPLTLLSSTYVHTTSMEQTAVWCGRSDRQSALEPFPCKRVNYILCSIVWSGSGLSQALQITFISQCRRSLELGVEPLCQPLQMFMNRLGSTAMCEGSEAASRNAAGGRQSCDCDWVTWCGSRLLYRKTSNKRPRRLFEQSANTVIPPAFSRVPACESIYW